jgi:hypothetical protein
VPSLQPITFIKSDSDNSYTIKQVPHQQQQQYLNASTSAMKHEQSENNIINFKNLQKNLELIEQHHVGQYHRTQAHPARFVTEVVSDDDDEEGAELTMFDAEDDDDITLSPLEWDCNDVLEFLKRNNCSQHCELFMKNKIDGKKLLQLTQNEIIQLLGMKVGPAIKVYDLIQQIKVKVAPYMGGSAQMMQGGTSSSGTTGIMK